ncbi:diguanylate cyclase [Aquabacterium sp. A7-Y]|uniref:diguanylate cyclase domain-containing protein n=1 Tax=Aquabacterium sp. A7-Y TaxID=1349605 RepID=UPI00223E2AA4|nr:diguanylate cyclase [Aquabacterium sp. A7-Y]MCW7540649.1 diguanylate cyclase [Aquabacterium sp. A7-Y]
MLQQRRSFRVRLAAGVALVHAVLMALFVAHLVIGQQRFLHERHVQRSMSLTQGIAQHAVNDLLSADLAAAQEIIQGFVSYPELRYAAVLDPTGRIVAHTQLTRVGMYMTDRETRRMLDGPLTAAVLVDDGQVLDVAAPVLWKGKLLGWVRFAAGMEGVNEQLHKVTIEGLGLAALAVALGVVLAVWMARSTTRGLYDLIKVADATGRGDRNVRAAAEHNEIGRLGASFNEMLDALAARENELRAANQELESRVEQRTAALGESEEALVAILEQANDAFVSVSDDGRVVNWNRAAEQTFGWSRQEAIGAPLAELIMPPEMRGMHPGWMRRYLEHGGATRMVDRRAELKGWRRDGTTFPVEVAVRVRNRRDGTRFFDAFMRDISERKSLEAQLQALAMEDALTMLPNRRAALLAIPPAQARAIRSNRKIAILYLDLDGFKAVNDRLGHPAGDEVLRSFARRVKVCVRASDLVARLGGDEFVVLLEGVTDAADVRHVAAKIIDAGSRPYPLGAAIAEISVSAGVRIVDNAEEGDPADLLADADEALYGAKRAGKCRAHVWEPSTPAVKMEAGSEESRSSLPSPTAGFG